jgi:hypothetical protein
VRFAFVVVDCCHCFVEYTDSTIGKSVTIVWFPVPPTMTETITKSTRMKVEAKTPRILMIHRRKNLRRHLHLLRQRHMIHPTKRAYYPQCGRRREHGGAFPVSCPLYGDVVVAHKVLPYREIAMYGPERMQRMIRASKRGSAHAGEYQRQRQCNPVGRNYQDGATALRPLCFRPA